MQNLLAEMIGTMLLIVLGDGVVANVVLTGTKGEKSGWIVITTGWGIAVAMAAYAVGRISGAHLNPGADPGAGDDRQLFAGPTCPATSRRQIVGRVPRRGDRWLAYRPHFPVTEDKDSKLAVFATGPAIRNAAANLTAEIIGTAALVFGILAIAGNAQTLVRPNDVDLSAVFSRGLQPLLVGVLVLGVGLSLGGPTGYAIDPARDLGPRLAHALLPIPGKRDSDWAYTWIPIVGPIIGAMRRCSRGSMSSRVGISGVAGRMSGLRSTRLRGFACSRQPGWPGVAAMLTLSR